MKTPVEQRWLGGEDGRQHLLSPGDPWEDDNPVVADHPDWFVDLVGIADTDAKPVRRTRGAK